MKLTVCEKSNFVQKLPNFLNKIQIFKKIPKFSFCLRKFPKLLVYHIYKSWYRQFIFYTKKKRKSYTICFCLKIPKSWPKNIVYWGKHCKKKAPITISRLACCNKHYLIWKSCKISNSCHLIDQFWLLSWLSTFSSSNEHHHNVMLSIFFISSPPQELFL